MTKSRDERLRRILLAILLGMLALPVLAFGVLWVWIEASAGDPPALFADVPEDFINDGPWVARMNATFPSGSPEAVLIQRLQGEGFKVDPAARMARYDWSHGFCAHEIHAAWTAEDGRVTDSRARYANVCP